MMPNKTLKKISENPNLIAFCNKILGYNTILENEMSRNMFLVSLISADTLIDEHACDDTINICNFILSNMDLMMLEEDVKKNVVIHLKNGIRIAKRDKKQFNSK